MGMKKTLLLGWLTRGVRLAAGAAQARRDAVKRYGLAGGTRRSASMRARVARRSWAGFVGRVREWEGRRAWPGWLTRPSRPGLLLLPLLSFLFFLFFFYFVFLSLLFVANLFRV